MTRSFARAWRAWMVQACITAGLAVPTLAAGQSWFPLDTGRVWILEDGASRKVQATESTESGEIVFTEESLAGGLSFQIRWRVERDGSVWMLGYQDLEGDFSFDPPLLWLPAKLEKGVEWKNESARLNSDGKPVGSIDHTRRATGEERIEFPWGTVDAMRVESVGDRVPVASIASRETDPRITAWVIYYAPELGLVRHGLDERSWIDVIGFGIGFVRTENSTWGSSKSWYAREGRSR